MALINILSQLHYFKSETYFTVTIRFLRFGAFIMSQKRTVEDNIYLCELSHSVEGADLNSFVSARGTLRFCIILKISILQNLVFLNLQIWSLFGHLF